MYLTIFSLNTNNDSIFNINKRKLALYIVFALFELMNFNIV